MNDCLLTCQIKVLVSLQAMLSLWSSTLALILQMVVRCTLCGTTLCGTHHHGVVMFKLVATWL